MGDRDDDHRCVIALIDERDLVDIINWTIDPRGKPMYRLVSEGEEVPSDSRVGMVTHDYSRRAIAVRLHHPSFDEVPPGAEIPVWPGCCKLESVAICIEPRSDVGSAVKDRDDFSRATRAIAAGR